MANILALEASSESCSVTLLTPDFEKTLEVNEPRSHSKHFLPLIQALLDESSLPLTDITLIACGNGPGSFTGLRICFGMAQGLAYGLNIPLLTASSLESMAHSFKEGGRCLQSRAVSILDARMNEVYLGEFNLTEDHAKPIGSLQLLSIGAAEEYVGRLLAADEATYALLGPGTGLLNLPPLPEGKYSLQQQVLPHSSSVARIALRHWLDGEVSTADSAQICYLRNSVSWDKRKRIRAHTHAIKTI